jgi:AraC-like DNA-binding protein
MIPLTYQEEYSKKSFFDLIRAFGELNNESEIRLDKKAGEGSIKVLDIEEGLQIRIWDCTFNTELNIHRKTCENPADKTFTLVYYLTPGTFSLQGCPGANGTINQLWNTVFMTSDAEFNVKIMPGKPMQCLSLNFTPQWLQENIFVDVDFQDHFFQQQVIDTKPCTVFESINNNEKMVIANLFQNKYHQSFGKFFFRSKALNLLTEFFLKMRRRISSHRGTALYHEQQIVHAEKKLMDNLHNGLPDIKVMASELMISESTLKRYFKKIYGKNIYEYYLEKKMIHARQLLDSRKSTVTEIAYTLGYEKVSQFITMFKRFYGIQPGAYKQAQLSSNAA